MQLFDSKKLCYTVKNILPCRLRPDTDVQLIFVGEENTNVSLLLYRSGHDVLCLSVISTFFLLK